MTLRIKNHLDDRSSHEDAQASAGGRTDDPEKTMSMSTAFNHPNWTPLLHRNVATRSLTCPFSARQRHHRNALPSVHPSYSCVPPTCSLSVPPLAVLLTVSVVSTWGRIPSSVRNAPTAFLIAAALCNLNLLSPSQEAMKTINAILSFAPHAVVLLLLSSSLSSSTQSTIDAAHQTSNRPPYVLLKPFLVGAVATFVSALLPAFLPPLSAAMDTSQLAALLAAFTATYVGGSLNFLVVARALRLPPRLSAAAVAVDMSAMALYFAALFVLAARIRPETKRKFSSPGPSINRIANVDQKGVFNPLVFQLRNALRLVIPLLVSFVIVNFSETAVRCARLPSTVSLMLSSVIALAMSNVSIKSSYSKFVSRWLSSVPTCATIALNLFFAALGGSARLSAIMSASPTVLACAVIILLGHSLILFLIGRKVLNIPSHHLLIASNCNVGGATTAPAYAASCGWDAYVPAAIAAGTLGYVIATPLALLVFKIVLLVS